MSDFGWVDPANTANISLFDFPPAGVDPTRLRTGAQVYLPKAAFVQLTETPQPQWDVYTLVQATNPPPGRLEYYDQSLTYAFRNASNTGPGTVGDGTSIVQETLVYSQIPIADLFRVKREEIRAQDQTVRYNAVDTALNANWWLVVTQDMRFELDGIQGNWAQRQIDGKVWPTGTNNPWVGVYNAATTDARRVQVPGADAAAKADTWNTLYTEKTQHDQATGNATTASLDALDVEYDDGNGDWQAVADHDAANPIWGYPPTVNIDPEAAVFFGA